LIEIEAVMEDDGTLRACKALGHARAGKNGADIVCAAVSVLMRTAFETLSDRNGISIKYGAPEPGNFWLEVDYSSDGKDFLFATGAFLIEGLRSVAQEFPGNCRLNIRTLRRT
jgi:uncharacterized protein YsxB (DUF464 family)